MQLGKTRTVSHQGLGEKVSEHIRSSEQIVGLDALRFFAALLVVFFHLGFWPWAYPTGKLFVANHGTAFPALWFLNVGWIGVEIFFVISGFVIAYSSANATTFSFFRSRVLRLVPAAWICATITLLASLEAGLGAPETLALPYLKSMTFWPRGPWLDGVFWTLPIEVAFYAWVFFAMMIPHPRAIEIVIGTLGLLSATFLAIQLTPDSVPWYIFSRLPTNLFLHFECFFGLGVFLWLCLFRGPTISRLCVVAACGIGCLISISGHSQGQSEWTGMVFSVVPVYLIWLFSVALIIASVRWNAWAHQTFRPYVSMFRTLGLATYPLYLLHQIAGNVVIGMLVAAGVEAHLALVIAIAGVIAGAVLIAIYLEPLIRAPIRSLLNGALRFFSERLARSSFMSAPPRQ